MSEVLEPHLIDTALDMLSVRDRAVVLRPPESIARKISRRAWQCYVALVKLLGETTRVRYKDLAESLGFRDRETVRPLLVELQTSGLIETSGADRPRGRSYEFRLCLVEAVRDILRRAAKMAHDRKFQFLHEKLEVFRSAMSTLKSKKTSKPSLWSKAGEVANARSRESNDDPSSGTSIRTLWGSSGSSEEGSDEVDGRQGGRKPFAGFKKPRGGAGAAPQPNSKPLHPELDSHVGAWATESQKAFGTVLPLYNQGRAALNDVLAEVEASDPGRTLKVIQYVFRNWAKVREAYSWMKGLEFPTPQFIRSQITKLAGMTVVAQPGLPLDVPAKRGATWTRSEMTVDKAREIVAIYSTADVSKLTSAEVAKLEQAKALLNDRT